MKYEVPSGDLQIAKYEIPSGDLPQLGIPSGDSFYFNQYENEVPSGDLQMAKHEIPSGDLHQLGILSGDSLLPKLTLMSFSLFLMAGFKTFHFLSFSCSFRCSRIHYGSKP
jgi:hypothetical protein